MASRNCSTHKMLPKSSRAKRKLPQAYAKRIKSVSKKPEFPRPKPPQSIAPSNIHATHRLAHAQGQSYHRNHKESPCDPYKGRPRHDASPHILEYSSLPRLCLFHHILRLPVGAKHCSGFCRINGSKIFVLFTRGVHLGSSHFSLLRCGAVGY